MEDWVENDVDTSWSDIPDIGEKLRCCFSFDLELLRIETWWLVLLFGPANSTTVFFGILKSVMGNV